MARRNLLPEKEIKIQNNPRKPAGMEQRLYHQDSKCGIVSNDSQSKRVVRIGFEDDLKIISRKHLHLIWLRLYDEYRYPVGKALLGMELKIDGLPEDIPNPAKVERQPKTTAHNEGEKNPMVENLPDVPKPTINLKRKVDEFLHE
jgi:hypothetical protein